MSDMSIIQVIATVNALCIIIKSISHPVYLRPILIRKSEQILSYEDNENSRMYSNHAYERSFNTNL
jgi:hypothetical protein